MEEDWRYKDNTYTVRIGPMASPLLQKVEGIAHECHGHLRVAGSIPAGWNKTGTARLLAWVTIGVCLRSVVDQANIVLCLQAPCPQL